jgi:hypothetical protein
VDAPTTPPRRALEISHAVPAIDQSGVHATLVRHPSYGLVLRWNALQPDASQRPADVRALNQDISAALQRCMDAACVALDGHGNGTPDAWLDASYVLERLLFCVSHGVPYVERPRGPQPT